MLGTLMIKSNLLRPFQFRNVLLYEEKEDHRISSAPNRFDLSTVIANYHHAQSFVQANDIRKRRYNTVVLDTLLLLAGL